VKPWITLVSGVLGGVTGVVVYLLVMFGPHYPAAFWGSVLLGVGIGLALGYAAIRERL
jgi:hypothetical protein